MGMRQILGKLAGQTAIYGTSTIVARFLNYMLLPLYTYTLSTSDYGVLTEFMSYIAVLQVLLTLGLETGCFRFANKEGYEPRKVFSGAILAVSAVSAVFLLLMILFGKSLAVRMGYGGYWNIYIYIGVILFADCFTAILFAKLRCESKAWKFAVFKTIKILTEAGTNLLLFLWYPGYAAAHPDNLLSGLIRGAGFLLSDIRHSRELCGVLPALHTGSAPLAPVSGRCYSQEDAALFPAADGSRSAGGDE